MAVHGTPDQISQKGMVITDDVTYQPILDFDRYSDTIVNIVMNSYPKFSLGIYGEWGTGKTTLMKTIENKLNQKGNEDILTVWFNAWRYEREEHFALVSLLKTIAFKMDEQPRYAKVREILYKSVLTALKGLASKYVFSDKYVDEFEKNFTSKMKALAATDKDTVYFQGIKQIEDSMKEIHEKSPQSRVVVFIDDIDRCSPKKALEVLESVKVFLGIDGFIYIMGISHETIAKLISAEYEKSGVKGEQYIKKIIQIPIALQQWNIEEVKTLVTSLLHSESMPSKYRDVISNNLDPISKAVEPNPREVKRFLNNFIVAYEIYGDDKRVKLIELLILQALNVRWGSFYQLITNSTKELREDMKKYSGLTEEQRTRVYDAFQKNEEVSEEWGKFNEQSRRLLNDFRLERDLWDFIKLNSNTIFNITDWDAYRRAGETVAPTPTAGMELAYSCWRSPERDKEFGRKMYTFQVMIDAPTIILDRIEYVTYRLPPSWPEANRLTTVGKEGRSTCFGKKELAWGASTIDADVKIEGQAELVPLSHAIILTETGPRLLCEH